MVPGCAGGRADFVSELSQPLGVVEEMKVADFNAADMMFGRQFSALSMAVPCTDQ